MKASNHKEDKDLVERIACGDQDAFRTLFERLMGDVFKLSYAMLLDRQMAEDATQEAFIKLWNNAENWRPEASIKTWLLRVSRNLCLDIIQKRKNDLKKYQGLYQDHLSSGGPALPSRADDKISMQDNAKIIKNAISLLPERQREAVTLVYYMGIGNSEASHIMNMTASAFDSLLARARRGLRDRLDDDKNELKGCFIHGS